MHLLNSPRALPSCPSARLLRAALGTCLAILAAAPLAADDAVPKPGNADYRTGNADYRIVPRDQVRFQVTGEPDDPLLQRVSSAGEISIPLLGAVKVAGRTLRAAENLMEKLYRDGGFYLNPQVILSFENYAPRNVSVLGQVNNPSSIDFSIEREQMGIVSAITRAGGFTRVARPDSVKVMRTVDGRETVITVNVSAYLNEASKGEEFKLMPDDVVFVPERVF
jgi:protein involved in polysaccharide export with SLBB domain